MIQKMKNLVPINVHDVDLNSVTDIEVCLKHGSTELLYSGDQIQIGSESQLLISVDKSVAATLDPSKYVYGQVMWTDENDIPDATDIFTITVRKLLKEAGYGD